MEIVLLADALEGLRTLEPENVHTCVTSPPYYNLRDYGVAGQIGNEDTPEEFVEKLVEVFREVRRVLRPDGTLWVNIGDSYATRSGPQPPTNTRNSCGHTAKRTPSGYKYKDLIGIPWLLALDHRAGRRKRGPAVGAEILPRGQPLPGLRGVRGGRRRRAGSAVPVPEKPGPGGGAGTKTGTAKAAAGAGRKLDPAE